MDFSIYSDEVQKIMENAFLFAEECKNRYLMPEHLLYAMTMEESFVSCFEAYGGNCEQLQKDLRNFVRENGGQSDIEQGMVASEDYKETFQRAFLQMKSSGRQQVELVHLFAAIMSLEESYAVYYVVKQQVDLLEMLGELSRETISENQDDEFEEEIEFSDDGIWTFGREETKKQNWQEYVECVNDTCMDKSPMIGREKELERTIQILCRMEKNNVIHVGEPGVGKTALVRGLAQLIEQNKVPGELAGAKIYAMDMGTMIAGTQYRGEFEQRFRMVMKGLEKLENPILYLDEIHNIVGAGATGEGSLDLSNMLKPYLTEGKIKMIGATTYEEYRRYIMKNKSLMRRFQKVDIPEPTIEEAVEILKGLKKHYEKFHGVKYRTGVLEYAVEMSSRHIHDRFLPDKAIDLLDEAGAYRKLHPLPQKSQSVGKDLIDDMLSLTCQVPKQRVEQSDAQKLAHLGEKLGQKIFGQAEAIREVTNAVLFSRAGLNEPGKPVASFLFVGPTGVGKTETAKMLAQELGISFVRFDMSEYAEKHTVAKLIGAPAGYVGYEDGGLLTEEIRKHPYAVLLLDEIEKAHPDIYQILLQVMDYATLTDNQGRKTDFTNIILIMTSNAGAAGVGKTAIGFGDRKMDESAISEAVKRTFQPEFRNRLSKIVQFHGMDEDMAYHIAEKKLEQLKSMLRERKVELSYTKEVISYVQQKGITREYGARQIDRVIAGEIKPLLVEHLLFGKLKKGGNCTIVIKNQKLTLQ